MRVWIVAVIGAASMIPATADTPAEQLNIWREVTFTAPIPCSVVCPYWLDVANTDVDGNGEEDIAFDACRNPGGMGDRLGGTPVVLHEQGSTYDDVVVGPRPEDATVVIFDSYPWLEWDTLICSEDGQELAYGSDLRGRNDCGGPLYPSSVPVACSEHAVTTARAGALYILRAYNWSDPFPLRARYRFSSSGTCEAPS